MNETQTPLEPTPQEQPDQFDDILAMQAPDVARRLIEQQEPYTREATVGGIQDPTQEQGKKSRNFAKTAAILTAVALPAGALGAVTANALKAPEFSEETTTYTVEPGDGLINVAQEIKGVETVRMNDTLDSIAGDPANIDVLKDGLQPGEQIVIPVSVKNYEDTTE